MREKIHAALDKMLETPKSKGFLNHLITAYFPITNVMKVIDKPRGEFKCVLTRDNLISFEEILEGIHSETFKNDFMTFIIPKLRVKTLVMITSRYNLIFNWEITKPLEEFTNVHYFTYIAEITRMDYHVSVSRVKGPIYLLMPTMSITQMDALHYL